MNTVYIVCLVIGLVGTVGTLLIGDLGSDVDGLPFLNLTMLATAVLGIGAGGAAASLLGWGPVGSAVTGVGVAAALVFATRGVLLPFLLRQQSNSHTGRQSYVGLIGTVTLPIEPGGWGEVAFTDTEGNRVRSRAVSAEPVALHADTRVYIGDVDDAGLHVVSIPGDPGSHHSRPEQN